MRRTHLLGAFLVLGCAAAFAQDQPPATSTAAPPAAPAPQPAGPALRVSLDVASQVDGEPEAVNGFQYFLFERLANFGLRVDSLRPAGDARFDGWMSKKVARWEKAAPEAPPATLAISGSAGCTYNNSEFFGQGQAHNFKGEVRIDLKGADGKPVATFGFKHEWGALQTSTKNQVLQRYNQMVATGIALGLLTRPEVQAGVPEDKRAELATWITDEKTKLHGFLREKMPDGGLTKFLEELPTPKAPGAKDGQPKR